jgi:hypothetical protein
LLDDDTIDEDMIRQTVARIDLAALNPTISSSSIISNRGREPLLRA